MASHRKLRAASVVAVVAVVAGPAPVAAWAAPDLPAAAPSLSGPSLSAVSALSVAPSPDPFADLTAEEIADRAVTATRSATSLRMAGRIVTDGQPLDIDLALDDREECTGVMKIKGGTAELRKADRITYLKGDETFWRVSMASQGMAEAQIAATIELVKGRWLKIAPGQPGSGDLGNVCDLKGLLSDLDKNKNDKEEDKGGALTRGPDAEVDGTPVATLVKKKAGGETSTVSVSREGKPYILKTVKTGGAEPGSITLSDYDKPVDVVVPPADETVDLSKLVRTGPA
ncbi:hypothetical protein [Streptomyces sp. NPDC058664]|uniref:hypothetical protein n=1 Tax=unclassified Streptomyces TaxID=2593676 RepID=UPI003655CAB1